MKQYLKIEEFIEFLINLKKIMNEKHTNKLLLFGHSYGMSCAILTAYIILVISGKLKAFNNNKFTVII